MVKLNACNEVNTCTLKEQQEEIIIQVETMADLTKTSWVTRESKIMATYTVGQSM
jgi:hypothetical protein